MLIDRRALLKTGAITSVAALGPQMFVASSIASPAGSQRHVERFVFDTRFADAIAAGRSAAARGIPTSGVNGDMTSLWYNDLNLRWKERAMTLAGVTAEDALFVLATLAPEYRMRVVQQVELSDAKSGRAAQMNNLPLYSWVIAPKE